MRLRRPLRLAAAGASRLSAASAKAERVTRSPAGREDGPNLARADQKLEVKREQRGRKTGQEKRMQRAGRWRTEPIKSALQETSIVCRRCPRWTAPSALPSALQRPEPVAVVCRGASLTTPAHTT